ncbi:hypothetical protein OYC64_004439 [Pagothenia borchgrevinki]|uniref:Uncharacterized protein n=1 Tax=Pagothenia borchgrevinki TaxID=8213 RepID=A0ABD2FYD1_PAGBO
MEPQSADGRVQQQRPDSPSCLSLKSDSSKDDFIDFKGRPPSADQKVQQQRPDSPSCLSFKERLVEGRLHRL